MISWMKSSQAMDEKVMAFGIAKAHNTYGKELSM